MPDEQDEPEYGERWLPPEERRPEDFAEDQSSASAV